MTLEEKTNLQKYFSNDCVYPTLKNYEVIHVNDEFKKASEFIKFLTNKKILKEINDSNIINIDKAVNGANVNGANIFFEMDKIFTYDTEKLRKCNYLKINNYKLKDGQYVLDNENFLGFEKNLVYKWNDNKNVVQSGDFYSDYRLYCQKLPTNINNNNCLSSVFEQFQIMALIASLTVLAENNSCCFFSILGKTDIDLILGRSLMIYYDNDNNAHVGQDIYNNVLKTIVNDKLKILNNNDNIMNITKKKKKNYNYINIVNSLYVSLKTNNHINFSGDIMKTTEKLYLLFKLKKKMLYFNKKLYCHYDKVPFLNTITKTITMSNPPVLNFYDAMIKFFKKYYRPLDQETIDKNRTLNIKNYINIGKYKCNVYHEIFTSQLFQNVHNFDLFFYSKNVKDYYYEKTNKQQTLQKFFNGDFCFVLNSVFFKIECLFKIADIQMKKIKEYIYDLNNISKENHEITILSIIWKIYC